MSPIVRTIQGAVIGPAESRRSPDHLRLLGVQFVTDTKGFLIRCYEAGRGCRKELAVTKDGGRTWKTVTSIPRLSGLTFVSSDLGYALRRRHVLRTDDGGRSFSAVSKLPVASGTEPEGENTSLSFVDGEHGWVATTAALYSTSDGGETWSGLSFSCPQRFVGIGSTSFVDLSTGFVTCEGEGATDMSEKALYRTDDGGRTWTLVSAAEVDQNLGRLPWIGTGAQISFLDSTIGFIMAGRYGLARSDDGGRTFRTILHTDDVDDVAGTSWLDTDTGFAALYQGRLVRTDDGGEHWRVVYPRAAPSPIDGVTFLTARVAVGVEPGGVQQQDQVILRSMDGGQTWHRVMRFRRTAVLALARIGRHALVAMDRRTVGPSHREVNDLLRSADRGERWRRTSAPFGINSVSAPSLSLAFVVDRQSHLRRSDGRGHVWDRVGDERLGVVDFTSFQNGWGVPVDEQSTLLHSADGGRSWTAIRIEGDPTILTLDFLNARMGWVLANRCRWGQQGSPKRVCPNGVEQVLLRTTDGGETWEAIRVTRVIGAIPIEFVSRRVGFAFAGATIYRTGDGGVTWRRI